MKSYSNTTNKLSLYLIISFDIVLPVVIESDVAICIKNGHCQEEKRNVQCRHKPSYSVAFSYFVSHFARICVDLCVDIYEDNCLMYKKLPVSRRKERNLMRRWTYVFVWIIPQFLFRQIVSHFAPILVDYFTFCSYLILWLFVWFLIIWLFQILHLFGWTFHFLQISCVDWFTFCTIYIVQIV